MGFTFGLILGLVLGWYARRKLVDGRVVGPIASKDDPKGEA